MSLLLHLPSLSLSLECCPRPRPTVHRIRGPRCHSVVIFLSLRRRLSRRRQKPSWIHELFCERHEGLLTMWLGADISLARKASLFLCERQSGSKPISLSLHLLLPLPLSLSLSIPG